MKLKCLVCVAAQLFTIVSPLSSAAFPAIRGCTQSAPASAASASEEELAFRLSHGFLILVEGEIGTLGHLKFALDTGATVTIVDTKVADKLKVARQPTESFNFDRKLRWQQGVFSEIQFGPLKRANVAAFVGDLAQYSEFTDHVDAVIGLDLLGSANFTVDYAAGKIVFHAVRHGANTEATDVTASGIVLKILIDGQPVRLVVDTGFPGALLFEERLLESVPGLVTTAATDSKVMMGDRLHGRESTLKRVSIGRTTSDLRVLLTPSPSAEILPGIHGVLGIAPLHAKRVTFDFLTGSLDWE